MQTITDEQQQQQQQQQPSSYPENSSNNIQQMSTTTGCPGDPYRPIGSDGKELTGFINDPPVDTPQQAQPQQQQQQQQHAKHSMSNKELQDRNGGREQASATKPGEWPQVQQKPVGLERHNLQAAFFGTSLGGHFVGPPLKSQLRNINLERHMLLDPILHGPMGMQLPTAPMENFQEMRTKRKRLNECIVHLHQIHSDTLSTVLSNGSVTVTDDSSITSSEISQTTDTRLGDDEHDNETITEVKESYSRGKIEQLHKHKGFISYEELPDLNETKNMRKRPAEELEVSQGKAPPPKMPRTTNTFKPTTSTKTPKFKCRECNGNFNHEFIIRNHIQASHQTMDIDSCIIQIGTSSTKGSSSYSEPDAAISVSESSHSEQDQESTNKRQPEVIDLTIQNPTQEEAMESKPSQTMDEQRDSNKNGIRNMLRRMEPSDLIELANDIKMNLPEFT